MKSTLAAITAILDTLPGDYTATVRDNPRCVAVECATQEECEALDALERAGFEMLDSGAADPGFYSYWRPVGWTQRYQLQTRDAWAGRPGGTWLPAVAGTVNQTGQSDEEASTFASEAEAEEAAAALEAEGLTDWRVVEL